MYTKKTLVKNPTGLHARPAAMLAAEAGRHEVDVELRNATKGGDFKTTKSMIAIMTASLSFGDEVEFRADGDGEIAAVDALVTLVDSGFGE